MPPTTQTALLLILAHSNALSIADAQLPALLLLLSTLSFKS
jgi:hypothetical protein